MTWSGFAFGSHVRSIKNSSNFLVMGAICRSSAGSCIRTHYPSIQFDTKHQHDQNNTLLFIHTQEFLLCEATTINNMVRESVLFRNFDFNLGELLKTHYLAQLFEPRR